MKKIIMFIIIALTLAGCSVQKSVIPSTNIITEYRATPKMSGCGINGEVYLISFSQELNEEKNNVKYKVSYKKIFDLCCINVPNLSSIQKPKI